MAKKEIKEQLDVLVMNITYLSQNYLKNGN